jgi:DNA-binding transcriptional LysR family regulator
MELKWLEDLLVLLEEQSISRAAMRRHVTQPAYSRRIRLLEQWLGVELVDRGTKPIKIRASALALEEEVRELVNRFYAMRNRAHESGERVTFVAQHTLAISRFPVLIREVKNRLPESSYRVVPANYEECESLFYSDADLLLCYQTPQRHFDFSHKTVHRLELGQDRLLPVASATLAAELGELRPGMTIPLLMYQQGALAAELGELRPGMTIPLLMYQQGGFLADALAAARMPELIRDFRVESICESAFSASLKEMALAHMGIAWLPAAISSARKLPTVRWFPTARGWGRPSSISCSTIAPKAWRQRSARRLPPVAGRVRDASVSADPAMGGRGRWPAPGFMVDQRAGAAGGFDSSPAGPVFHSPDRCRAGGGTARQYSRHVDQAIAVKNLQTGARKRGLLQLAATALPRA